MTSPSGQVLFIVRSLLAAHLRFALPYWAVVVMVSLTIAALMEIHGTLGASIWNFAAYHLRWLVFSLAIMMTTHLPVYVGFGVTRRRLVQGTTLFIAAFSILGGALIALGFGIERALFGTFDTGWVVTFLHLFDSTGSLTLAVVEYGLIFFAYSVSGWMVGTGYYRMGRLGGVLFTVPALIPLVVVETSGWGSAYGRYVQDLFNDPSAVTVTVGTLAVCAAGLAVNAWLVRTTPIANK